jgi:hypothetical protein
VDPAFNEAQRLLAIRFFKMVAEPLYSGSANNAIKGLRRRAILERGFIVSDIICGKSERNG